MFFPLSVISMPKSFTPNSKFQVKHLTDKQGYFDITWGDLFRWNYSPKMFMTIKKELKVEIKAQTELFGTVWEGHAAPV